MEERNKEILRKTILAAEEGLEVKQILIDDFKANVRKDEVNYPGGRCGWNFLKEARGLYRVVDKQGNVIESQHHKSRMQRVDPRLNR